MLKRYFIRFSGQVQRVQFRVTAQHFARELGCTGWVKNIPSGEVEMEVQGSQEAIEKLLQLLHSHPPINILDQEIQLMSVVTSDKEFIILR